MGGSAFTFHTHDHTGPPHRAAPRARGEPRSTSIPMETAVNLVAESTNFWYLRREGADPMARNQNTSISLGEHFTQFIAASVQAGRYSSASDVVRAGLRLLEEHEAKLRAVRQAIEEGEKSGYPDEAFDFDAFLGRMQEKHAPQV